MYFFLLFFGLLGPMATLNPFIDPEYLYVIRGFPIIACLIISTGCLALCSYAVVVFGLNPSISFKFAAIACFGCGTTATAIGILATVGAFAPLPGDGTLLNAPIVGPLAKQLQIAQTGVFWTEPRTGTALTTLQSLHPTLDDLSHLCYPGTNQLSRELIQAETDRLMGERIVSMVRGQLPFASLSVPPTPLPPGSLDGASSLTSSSTAKDIQRLLDVAVEKKS